jgi:hypothetical protein
MAVDQASINAQLQASLATVQAAIAAVGDISTASPFALTPVVAAIDAEIATLQDAIDEFDADIITTSVAGVVTGSPAPTIWPVLLSQASDSEQIANLLNALGYLQRLSKNIAQVSA